MAVTRGRGKRGKGEVLLKGGRVSDSKDEKVLEICFTTMGIHLMLLNCK